MGCALAQAEGQLAIGWALCALWSALWLQISTNFANDYFDFKKGADTAERLGPVRATAAGLVSPAAMRNAMIIASLLSVCGCVGMVVRGGEPMIWVGVLSLVSAIAYTGGPYPLGYNGLGDIFAFAFFGPVAVAGTYYLQTLNLPVEIVVAGCAPGFFSVAILTVNNLRDIETDAKAGKRTLAVRFGEKFARAEYAVCLFFAAAIPLLLLLWGDIGWSWLASLVMLKGLKLNSQFSKLSGRELNPLLGETAKLLLIYSLVFSVGWVIR